MAILSKLRELSLPYNCYEVGHTWTPVCSEAALAVGYDCMVEGMKIYAPLYLISQALQRKFSLKSFLNTFQSIYTSSFFLGFNGFAFIFIFCQLRKLMGKFYYLHCSYFPAFMASFLAILIERKTRRGPLALYVTNVASETLFRMATARGKVKPLPGGEVYLFSATMAFFLYVTRKHGFSKDFVSLALKYVVGSSESRTLGEDTIPKSPIKPTKTSPVHIKGYSVKSFSQLGAILNKFWNVIRHHSCPHNDSCFRYAAEGFLRPLLVGYSVYLAIRSISFSSAIMKNPSVLLKILTDRRTSNLGLFLGGFVGTFRLISCCLRWLLGEDKEIYAIPAAFAGGLFMKFFPSSTLALYLMWKLAELAYLVGMQEGVLPEIKGSMLVLYASSTAVLFYAAVLEPHNLKPAYLKFLSRITHNKIGEINRHVLDIFGTHASRLYTNFWPELDLKFTSRVFQESVLLWMIH